MNEQVNDDYVEVTSFGSSVITPNAMLSLQQFHQQHLHDSIAPAHFPGGPYRSPGVVAPSWSASNFCFDLNVATSTSSYHSLRPPPTYQESCHHLVVDVQHEYHHFSAAELTSPQQFHHHHDWFEQQTQQQLHSYHDDDERLSDRDEFDDAEQVENNILNEADVGPFRETRLQRRRRLRNVRRKKLRQTLREHRQLMRNHLDNYNDLHRVEPLSSSSTPQMPATTNVVARGRCSGSSSDVHIPVAHDSMTMTRSSRSDEDVDHSNNTLDVDVARHIDVRDENYSNSRSTSSSNHSTHLFQSCNNHVLPANVGTAPALVAAAKLRALEEAFAVQRNSTVAASVSVKIDVPKPNSQTLSQHQHPQKQKQQQQKPQRIDDDEEEERAAAKRNKRKTENADAWKTVVSKKRSNILPDSHPTILPFNNAKPASSTSVFTILAKRNHSQKSEQKTEQHQLQEQPLSHDDAESEKRQVGDVEQLQTRVEVAVAVACDTVSSNEPKRKQQPQQQQSQQQQPKAKKQVIDSQSRTKDNTSKSASKTESAKNQNENQQTQQVQQPQQYRNPPRDVLVLALQLVDKLLQGLDIGNSNNNAALSVPATAKRVNNNNNNNAATASPVHTLPALRVCFQKALRTTAVDRDGCCANAGATNAALRLASLLDAEKHVAALCLLWVPRSASKVKLLCAANNADSKPLSAADELKLVRKATVEELAVLVQLAISDAHFDVMDFEGARNFAESASAAARSLLEAPAAAAAATTTTESTMNKARKLLLLWALMRLGKCFETFVAPDDASKALNEAFVLAVELDEKFAIAAVTAHAATVFELVAQFEDAFLLYARARALASEIGAQALLLDIEINFGVALLSSGDLYGAVEHLARFIPIAEQEMHRRGGEHMVLSRALANLGHAKLLLGDTAGARIAQEQEVEIATRSGDTMAASTALTALANAHRLAGDHRAALSCHTRELEIMNRMPQGQGRAHECYANIASCQRDMGQLVKARATFEKALSLATTANDLITQARCCIGLGFVDLDSAKATDTTATSTSTSTSSTAISDACIKFFQAARLIERVSAAASDNYMLKANCCETEWRVFDGLEHCYIQQGRCEDAARWADRKRMAPLTNILRRMSPSWQPVHSSPLRRMDANWQELMQRLGIDFLLCYSLQWDDTLDARVYLVSRSQHAANGDNEVDVVSRVFTLDPPLLAVLAAQRSKYHALICANASDTPLVPQLLSQVAEREALRMLASDKPCDQRLIFDDASFANASRLSANDIEWDTTLEIMSRSLVAPIANDLNQRLTAFGTVNNQLPTVCVVPDGFLTNVPFHALPFNSASASAANDDVTQTRLIDVCAVVMSPSIELLHHVSSSPSFASSASSSSSVPRTIFGTQPVVEQSQEQEEVANDQAANLHHSRFVKASKAQIVCVLRDALFNSTIPTSVLTVELSAINDIRDDFSGSFDITKLVADSSNIQLTPVLGCNERVRLTSEWIASCGEQATSKEFQASVAQKKAIAQKQIRPTCLWLPLDNDFCYRVAHETCVPLFRAFFVAGFPRVITTLWHGPSFPIIDDLLRNAEWLSTNPSSSTSLLPSSLSSSLPPNSASSSFSTTSRPVSVAHALRSAILQLKAQAVPLHSWASIRLLGLP